MSQGDILEKLREALERYDPEAVEKAARNALEQGISPMVTFKTLTDSMRELGEKFQRMEIFLVDLMLAADAMKAGVSVLNRRLSELSEKPVKAGTFVIGTVKGDLHDIGKNIVATMLSVAGFEVIDLGVDVSNSTFAEAVERYRPDILGLSALMTTTRPMQKDVIEYLKALELRDKCKILVGGGSVTKEYAEEIGADGYAPDAASAVEVAKKLVAGGVKEV